MVKLKRLILFTFALELLILTKTSANYIWPIDGKILLNSNFAECRPNHFHAGIDIHAKEATPLKAIEDGYVWHIAVNPFGYGKSLFLKLDDGRTVIYAHLQKFSKKLNQIVELEQQRRFSNRITLYFKKEQLKVNKGELVGYVGRTGAIGAHLHFEIRDSQNMPINPLVTGYSIIDSMPPLIQAFQVTPLDESSFASGSPFPIIRKTHYNGRYYTINDTININGTFGLEICTRDYQNEHSMGLNIQKIELFVNGKLTFLSDFRRFSYTYTKEVELEFNYNLYRTGAGRFHRLYKYGDNHQTFYKNGSGLIENVELKNINEVKIVCYDANSNRAILIFFLKKTKKTVQNDNIKGVTQTEGIFFYRNLIKIVLPNVRNTKIKKRKGMLNKYGEFRRQGDWVVGYFRLPPKKAGQCSLVVGETTFDFDYNTVLQDSGGTISTTDAQFLVDIEKNNSYEDLFARVRKTKESIPMGLKLKQGCYQVEPQGAIFRKAVTIIFPYPVAHSKKLGIYKKQKDGWLYLGCKYSLSKRAFLADSRHLGTFALIEDDSSPLISDFHIVKHEDIIKKIFFKNSITPDSYLLTTLTGTK